MILTDLLPKQLAQALPTAEQAVELALATVAIYLAALAAGRWLKRRYGVRLGVLYRLFCVALAANVALALFLPQSPWRAELAAALVLLAAIFALALADRFVGDIYFEQRRQTQVPKLYREVIAILVVATILILILQAGFDLRIPGLLAGSGIAAIIVGLAMQDLLGNIIAGLAIHLEKPFQVGDWLLVEGQHVEVMEINWRATRLRNNDRVFLDLPNSQLAKQTITNFTHSRDRHGLRLEVGIDYSMPPNRVKEALLHAARQAPGVLAEPPPKVFLRNFGDSSIEYQVRFWIQGHEKQNDIYDAIRTNIWYELHRRQIKIPFPIRTLHVERGRQSRDGENRAAALAMLRSQPLFQALADEQLDLLVARARLLHFGRGERIIEQGAAGESMFVLVSGEAGVLVAKN
ncbi:MAG: mechanosensitive ion channel, partial [Verrucomicrobia bacterium]|nr:mechanosensitive ion channel [Verrucomicrobiota bacterium]